MYPKRIPQREAEVVILQHEPGPHALGEGVVRLEGARSEFIDASMLTATNHLNPSLYRSFFISKDAASVDLKLVSLREENE